MPLVCAHPAVRFCSALADEQEERRDTQGRDTELFHSLFTTDTLLQKSLIDASEQMLTGFNQFSSSTILVNLTRILNAVLNLPDQINSKQTFTQPSSSTFRMAENHSTPSNYSHLIDLRSYTTKHIHLLKYQLLAFVNNILTAEFFVKKVRCPVSPRASCFPRSFVDQIRFTSRKGLELVERTHSEHPALRPLGEQAVRGQRRLQPIQQIDSEQDLRLSQSKHCLAARIDVRQRHHQSPSTAADQREVATQNIGDSQRSSAR